VAQLLGHGFIGSASSQSSTITAPGSSRPPHSTSATSVQATMGTHVILTGTWRSAGARVSRQRRWTATGDQQGVLRGRGAPRARSTPHDLRLRGDRNGSIASSMA